MKTITILTLIPKIGIIIIVSSFSCCKIQSEQQHKMTIAENKKEQVDTQHKEYRSHIVDSSQLQWSIWTDGWLYYHPDSGLLAQGGLLQLNEAAFKESNYQHQQEEQQIKSQSQTKLQQEEQQKTTQQNWISTLLYLSAGLLLVYIIYRLYR